MNNLWLVYALLSALMAALVSIFGKIGLQSIDANAATAVRSVIMALFLVIFVASQRNFEHFAVIFGDKKALLYIFLSGIAGALSWLFYFLALKLGKVAQVAPVDKFSVVIATVLAVIFLHEKLSLFNQIGVVLIAIGVVFVALG